MRVYAISHLEVPVTSQVTRGQPGPGTVGAFLVPVCQGKALGEGEKQFIAAWHMVLIRDKK